MIATQQPDVSAYTKYDIQLIKVAPDEVLKYSETRRASNGKIKSNHKNFVHLVGSYTYNLKCCCLIRIDVYCFGKRMGLIRVSSHDS